MKTQKQKWTQPEDKFLKNIITNSLIKDWSLISKEMKEKNYNKDIHQCKYRWNNHLNPILKKDIWIKEEEKRLLSLFEEIGPKWKKISNNLKGRSDNCVKNKFFSLIRKGLRYLLKYSGFSSKKFDINFIRPKILSDIYLKEINVFLPEEFVVKNNRVLRENDLIVKIKEYIFKNFLENDLDKKTNKFIILEILKYVDILNKNYISRKKNRILKLKRHNGYKFDFNNDIKTKNRYFKKNNIFKNESYQNHNYNYNLENNLIKNLLEVLNKYLILFSNQTENSQNKIISLYFELSNKCQEIKDNVKIFSLKSLLKLRKIVKKNFFFEYDKKMKEEINNILIQKKKEEEKNDLFVNSFFSNKDDNKLKSKKSNSLCEELNYNNKNNISGLIDNSFSDQISNQDIDNNFIDNLNISSTNSCINLN